jgi:hypothetical protein
VSLEQISKSPAFANQMQTDDETRMGIAQFFGDPQARTMVQQAGGIQPALKQIDNPMSFTPQRGLAPTGAVGDPNAIDHEGNAMARVSNQPAAPAVDFSQQNLNADIANLPVEEPTAPAAAAPPMRPRNADEYAQQNPSQVSVPGRPTVDWDNMSRGKKAMFLAFAGLGKFGDNLSGRNNSYLDQFMGNTMKQRDAQMAYDQNLPAIKAKATQDAYDRYLKNRGEQSTIAHTDAETADLQNGGGPRAMAKSAASRALSNSLTSAWETGKYSDPERFRAIAHANGTGIDPNEIDSMVDTITHNAPSGSKYDVWEENGVPVGLKTKDGRMIPEASINKNDPDQMTAFNAGKGGYTQSRKDKKEDQQAMADRMMNRPVVITNTETGVPRVVRGTTAEKLTDPNNPNGGYAGGNPDVVAKAKQKFVMFKDMRRAAYNLSTVLPTTKVSSTTIARLAGAMQENHGIMGETIRSKVVEGLDPAESKLAAAYLGLRDNILAAPKQMGIDPSDSRVQAIWNMMPAPSDLSNPSLSSDKMHQVYGMLENLEEANIGTSEQFGIQPGPTDANYEKPKNQPIVQMNDKMKKGRKSVDGGKTWTDIPYQKR